MQVCLVIHPKLSQWQPKQPRELPQPQGPMAAGEGRGCGPWQQLCCHAVQREANLVSVLALAAGRRQPHDQQSGVALAQISEVVVQFSVALALCVALVAHIRVPNEGHHVGHQHLQPSTAGTAGKPAGTA